MPAVRRRDRRRADGDARGAEGDAAMKTFSEWRVTQEESVQVYWGRDEFLAQESHCPSEGVTVTKDDIHLLYEYDRWANNRVFPRSDKAICRLPSATNLGGESRTDGF